METTLIAAFAAAFVVSAVDYWVYLGPYRSLIALLVAAASVWGLGSTGWTIPIAGAAGAFVAISVLALIERALRIEVRPRR